LNGFLRSGLADTSVLSAVGARKLGNRWRDLASRAWRIEADPHRHCRRARKVETRDLGRATAPFLDFLTAAVGLPR